MRYAHDPDLGRKLEYKRFNFWTNTTDTKWRTGMYAGSNDYGILVEDDETGQTEEVGRDDYRWIEGRRV